MRAAWRAVLALCALVGAGAGEEARVAALLTGLQARDGALLYQEGLLLSATTKAENVYEVEVNVKAVDPKNANQYKLLKCHGTLTESIGEGTYSVDQNSLGCFEEAPLTTETTPKDKAGSEIHNENNENTQTENGLENSGQAEIDQGDVQDTQTSWEGQSEEELEVTTEAEVHAVRLDHEVLPSNQITSGEQFVAVRREHTGPTPCIGCSSFVDVTAPGVDNLALLAVKHIDRHHSEERHLLVKVLTVERQVQVVNGVRYILILDVDFDKCSPDNFENCKETKTCKVSILEKPWLKLPDGSKFRAIVSNNCTNEYLFGDNGEVLPTIPEHENHDNEIDINFNTAVNKNQDEINHNGIIPTPDYDAIAKSGSTDDIIKVIHNTNLQATLPQQHERELTPDEIKNLEEQIIVSSEPSSMFVSSTEQIHVNQHKLKTYVDSAEPNVVQKNLDAKTDMSSSHSSLSADQQTALDGFMDYFNLDSQITSNQRSRRNADDTDKPYIQKLAQHLVDTLNGFDSHINNRELLEILSADEEVRNGKVTFFIRAKVAFSKQGDMKYKNNYVKICNAMIDASNPNAPRVLKSFCNPERTERNLGGRRKLDTNSPEILQIIQQALDKIETESQFDTKLTVLNVISADRQVVAGTLTRLSLELGFTNCPKSKSVDIESCELQKDMGSTVCKIESHNQPWFKSNKLTFECADPVTTLEHKQKIIGETPGQVDDPEIINLAQESLQQYELTSDCDNRLKIVKINSVTNQVVAGLLTKINYDVVLTRCTKGDSKNLEDCERVKDSPNRRCKASFWNRPWVKNGKEITVSCDNDNMKKFTEREITGGISTVDNNDPKYIKLAHESLEKLEQLSSSEHRQKIVEIKEMTYQVVAGTLTKIYFIVGHTKCLKNVVASDLDACELLENQPLRHCNSEIWDRPWIPNGKKITVTCADGTKNLTKRHIPGGVSIADKNDPENMKLAQESLKKLEQLSNSEHRQKIVEIKEVNTQVVAGTLTKIYFIVGHTKCLKNDVASNVDACELLENQPLRHCNSEIWDRPWISNEKEITVTCADETKKLTKRHIKGGVSIADKNDPKNIELAQESLEKLEQLSNSEHRQKIVEIKEVTTQVVAGTLTKIYFIVGHTKCLKNVVASDLDACELLENQPLRHCNSEIWDRPWIPNGKKITVTCADGTKNLTKKHIPGGVSIADKNDPENIELAQESLEKLEQLSNSEHRQKIVEIKEVTTQVVAGTLTKIYFIVGHTKCLKNVVASDLDACELLENQPLRHCNSEIWDRPWIPNGKKITVTCADGTKNLTKKHIPGGVSIADKNDPENMKLAQESLEKLEQLSNSEHRQKIVEIKEVTTQVVAGTLTKIYFIVGHTKCLKNDVASNVDACELLENQPLRHCNSEIWDRPWIPNEKEITVTCADETKKLTKRHIKGGVRIADKNDPKNIELAQESLEKLEQLSNSEHRQKIVEIKEVTTQVVAGTLTKIYFIVGHTKCLKNDVASNLDACKLLENQPLRHCNSEIWDRPWIPNGKEITITCKDEDKNRSKREVQTDNCGMPGGVCSLDTTNPIHMKLAEESLLKLEKVSNSEYRQKIVKIHSVTVQVVQGTLTKMNFTVGYTECPQNNFTSNLASCSLLTDKPLRLCHSEIWNRPWLTDGKEIIITCDDDGTNSEQTNSNCDVSKNLCKVSENDPENILLAEESLKHIEKLSESINKQKIVKIKSIMKKVVSGILHKIDFDVGYTQCIINDLPYIDHSCKLLDDAPIRHCHSEIWSRPWLHDDKQINVTCEDNIHENEYSCDLPVGKCNTHKHNPENIKLAEDSLKELETQHDTEYKQKIIRIRSVTRHFQKTVKTIIDFDVGITECIMNDKINNLNNDCPLLEGVPIRKCHSEIIDRPWLENDRKINATCNDTNNYYFEYTINKLNTMTKNKRDLPMIGGGIFGIEDIKIAKYATNKLNMRYESGNKLRMVKIRSVKREFNNALVNVNFDVAPTLCQGESKEDPDNCDFLPGMTTKHCHAKAWRRRNARVKDISCYCDDDTPMNLGLLDETLWTKDESADKLENRKQAQLALEKLTDTTYKMKALKMLSVSNKETDVSGKNLVFLAGSTNCSFELPLSKLSHCKVNKKTPVRICQAEIWSQGQLETTIQCDRASGRPKRSEVPKQADPNDYFVVLLAKDSIIQMELMSSGSSRQQLVKVTSAEILPGDIRRIKFDVAYTKCSKYEKVDNVDYCEPLLNGPHRECTSELWKRDWLKQGFALDVNCNNKGDVKLDDYETALQLADLSMKHIEAKYLHPTKQTVVRIIAMDKQVISGLHYRIKFEVGFTNCLLFDPNINCNVTDKYGPNKFCKSNIWLRPWLDQPPNIRVSCEIGNDTLNSDEIFLRIAAEQLFNKFIDSFKPDYINNREEFSKRFLIFKNNIRRIHELNVHEKGTAKYGITKFADLTYEEFKKKYTGLRLDLKSNVTMPMASIPQDRMTPESFDWREHGAVTEVKDQGQCGSCWAFSVTGNIEGQWFLKEGKLISLSEQELVDCDKMDEGCNGGLPDNAYRAIEQLGGLEEEKDYPYDAQNEKCKYQKDKVAAQITSAVNISSNEDDMVKWLVDNGPISIGINANGMQFYMGGVSHPWKMVCNPKSLDHGVLIVGYGVKNYPIFHKTLPYWIVKNSWGPSWGENGYYRVYRGDGTCGLNLMASSAVV